MALTAGKDELGLFQVLNLCSQECLNVLILKTCYFLELIDCHNAHRIGRLEIAENLVECHFGLLYLTKTKANLRKSCHGIVRDCCFQ